MAERPNPELPAPASDELLARMDAYWRAANYLAVGRRAGQSDRVA
jgi:phosphoketolase